MKMQQKNHHSHEHQVQYQANTASQSRPSLTSYTTVTTLDLRYSNSHRNKSKIQVLNMKCLRSIEGETKWDRIKKLF
jgi:hypothetical protein